MAVYLFFLAVGEVVYLTLKNLISNTTFYKLLLPGDVVLADRGFTIEEDMMIYGAKLEIPSFTKGKKQLSQREVEQSAQLSRVRVHVERVNRSTEEQIHYSKRPLQWLSMLSQGKTNLLEAHFLT